MGTDAEEFLCMRCSRHMKTCCQTCEIYTTPRDVERIADFTGREDFYEYRAPTNPVYLDNDDDPAWRDNVFRADGTRRVLKRRAEGDCTFLGPHGCTLPMHVRPLVCRIYPYDYDEHGIKPDLAQGCPLELLRPQQGLIEALDMNLQDAQRWRTQLYEEIRLEKTTDARRADLRPAV
jgi:Fe-S-cluster containining protein